MCQQTCSRIICWRRSKWILARPRQWRSTQQSPSAQRADLSAERQLAAALETQSMEGSNNWVVAPSRTATGRPILANDPHRQLGSPSLRYIVALNAPGLNII